MMKNKKRTTNISVFGSRVFDGCKTILQLGLRHSLIGVMIFSAGCNPSTTNYNQTIQQPGGSDPTKQSLQTGGPGSGGGGTGDGGGGQGVYCSETAKDSNIKGKLMVRDVYEAIKNHKRTMPSGKLGAGGSDKVDEASIKYLVEILRKYFGPASGNLEYVNIDYWKKFADSISFIPEDATLHPSQDANSPLALPEGCKIVQIAYWDESSGPVENGTLYVDKKTWKQLDQFNKIALLAHEFYFKQARKGGHKNSDFVRYKVGQLLSQDGLPAMFENWVPSQDARVKDVLPEKKSGFKYCKGISENDPTAKLQMYQYEAKDGVQNIVFPVISSSTVNFGDFEVPSVKFSTTNNKNISIMTDLLLPVSHFKQSLGSINDGRFLLALDELPMLSARYGRDTFIDTALGDPVEHFKARIIEVVKSSMLSQEVSWTVKSRSGSAKIQLHSPAFKRIEEQEQNQPVTKEQLTRSVNNQIIFKIIGHLMHSSDARKNEIVYPALMVLHKEIEEGMAVGVYPKDLPKWRAELRKIELKINEILTKQSGQPQKFVIANRNELLGSLPQKLYALKMNAYDSRQIMQGLGNEELSYGKEFPVSLREGSVSITDGSNTATFTLDCYDYIDIFKEKTKKSEYSIEVESVRLKDLRVVPEPQADPAEGSANYLRYRDEFIKRISGNIEIEKRDLDSGKCSSEDEYSRPKYCADLNSLLVDLRDESTVEMEEALDYALTATTYEGNLQSARILKLKKSQQKYLVIFAYPYDEEFLRGRSSDPGKISLIQVLRIP